MITDGGLRRETIKISDLKRHIADLETRGMLSSINTLNILDITEAAFTRVALLANAGQASALGDEIWCCRQALAEVFSIIEETSSQALAAVLGRHRPD